MLDETEIYNDKYRANGGITDTHLRKAYALMKKHGFHEYDYAGMCCVRKNSDEIWCPVSWIKQGPINETLLIELAFFWQLADRFGGKVSFVKKHNYWQYKSDKPEITHVGKREYVTTEWYLTIW